MFSINDNMNADMIIDALKDVGIRLWTENGKLRYSAPQGAMTGETVSVLKSRKSELISELESRKNELRIEHDEDNRYEKFALSGVQGAYLMGSSRNMEYGGVACHICMDFEYDRLEKQKVQQVWNRIISENDTLHTVITRDGWQRVLPQWDEFQVNENDFTALSAEDAEKALADVRKRLGNKAYETSVFPLFTIELSQCSDCTIMHFSINMLIVDWTSIWLMLSTFEKYYFEGCENENKLTITFRDYMNAYKNIVNTDKYKQAEKYWKSRINDIPPAPQLPVQDNYEYEFERFELVLSEKQWFSFKTFSQNAGVTPVAALVTAYSSVLERFSTNKKFSLNLTTLNRMPIDEQVKYIIGDFTSLSLISMDNTGEKSFAQRAAETNKNLFEALDNHLYSGIDVIREKIRLEPEQKFLMPYVFTSSVGLIKNEDSGSMRGKYKGGISQTPQVFIDCQVMDGSFGLRINWDVRKGIFPDGLAERMFSLFRERLEFLTESENNWKQSSLVETDEKDIFSDADNYEKLPEHLLHSEILKAGKLNPEKTAVIDSENNWSYAELLSKAAAIALELRKNNVSKGSNIAVVMPKSAWQAAAVTAILSENCAYVPIDAGHAVNRRNMILDNAGINVIVSVSGCIEESDKYTVICADRLADADSGILKADGDINSTAYIIHTSGSTGTPKGVVITHKGAVNTIEDINRRFGISSDDSILGLSQLNFDLSVYDIFGVLSAGGTLIYPDEKKYSNPSHWAELIEKYNITLWNSVPAFAQMLCSYLNSSKQTEYKNFKAVMLSGDWIPLELPDNLIKYMPNVRIACMGGATEASIWSNIHEYKGLKPEWKSIPYGRALLNQEMYVLDENLNICPYGVTGEICIAGYGLAEGYLNDREKTDKSFVTSSDGKRFYKTGDMGRYNSDNEIEFLGRLDTQVKIRGHRIELGEIESCIKSYESVENAVVILVKADSAARLTAFVKVSENTDENDIRKYAEDYIPDYMIPECFIFIDEIPLSPNGKTDMHKLNDMAFKKLSENKKDKENEKKPLTETEEKVSAIVKETLGIESVDPDINLYEYGANSLVMAQLAGNLAEIIKDESAFDSILMNLFENPTVRSAASAIDEINSQS